MSEQQKDSEVAGADSTSAVPTDSNPDASFTSRGTAVESAKPSRRRASKAKAAPEEGNEKPKPKKARASSRGSKGRNVLLDVPADGEALPESGQGLQVLRANLSTMVDRVGQHPRSETLPKSVMSRDLRNLRMMARGGF